MQAVYMNARAMASIVGTDLEGPSPDQEFLKQLFYHLVQDSRFAEASRVACIYSARAEPSQKIELIAYLLQEKLVPDLVRAEALYEYADLLQEANQVKQSDAQLEDAEKLYKKVGHAYGVLMIEMRRCTRQASRKSTTQVTERLYQIKQQLESIGYWEGARQAIKALYEIAQVSLDNELKNELDRELLRLRDIRGCPLDWVSQQLVTLATWDFSGANSAKMLSSLEALYESLNGMEAPRLRETTAYILSEKYKGLGEISKSAEWARINPEAYPNRWRFVYGADQFYKQLEETTEPADPDIEYEMLRTELARCAEDISAVTTPIGERYLGVMKVSSMCNFYLNQFQLRGFERTKSLVETCLEFAEARLDNLPPAGSKLWKGNLFEIRARLKFIEAHIEQPPNLNRVRASLTLYEQALAVYKSAGFAFQMASAQSQVGTCHQLLWLFEGAAPESLEFESAIECYESAATGLAQTPAPFISRRMNARILLELWSKGYLNNVKFRRPRVLFRYLGISRWSRIFRWMRLSKSIGSKGAAFFVWLGYKIKLPLEETLKWLDIAEKLTDQERHDLSALNSKQAILAKQGLRRDENVRVIYDTAVIIHMKAGDAKGLWNWLQKAKARSISDMLGLGFNLPDYLKQRVERDQKAQAMLEEEVKLIQKVNQDASDTQFYRRKELEAHRRAMQGVESLQEILVLREGRAVSHARLRGLRHHIMTKETGRRIFYVDWFTCGDKICALFVSDESDDIGYFDAQMTTIEVAEWKEAHLTSKNTKKKPLDDEDTSPLRAITRLVEPLLNVTKEGDLLVFCPTDVLHGIPMHAAVTSPEESEKPQFLIDRNPILYTSSLTIFEQCVLRAVSSRGKDTGHTEKFLAVYEQADFGLEEERYKIYKTSSKLASQVNAAVAVGSDVTRSAFKTACESDVVHFFGHFDYEAKNIMDQGLILASDNGAIKDPSTQLPEEGSHANVTEGKVSAWRRKASCPNSLSRHVLRFRHVLDEHPNVTLYPHSLCFGHSSHPAR